jgi:hypothetical protein
MAMCGGQRSRRVNRQRDQLVAREPANASPVHGRPHLPSAGYLLSQHLPKWDEWSSPRELIHPGDWPSISSHWSTAAKSCLQMGCGESTTSTVGDPESVGANAQRMHRVARTIGSQCFWGEERTGVMSCRYLDLHRQIVGDGVYCGPVTIAHRSAQEAH